jgi:CRP-like cAMP-binding protein
VSREKAEIVELLTETRLLTGWSHEELAALADAMSVRPLDPGELLFKEGEPGDALFLVLEGRLSVWRGEAEIGDILEGDHLGEGALVHAGPRRVSVRGADPATLGVVTCDAFIRFSEECPGLHAKLLRALLRETSAKMREVEPFLDTQDNIR